MVYVEHVDMVTCEHVNIEHDLLIKTYLKLQCCQKVVENQKIKLFLKWRTMF